CGGTHGALHRDDTADCCAFAVVNVGHRCNVMKHPRQGGDVSKLVEGNTLDFGCAGPSQYVDFASLESVHATDLATAPRHMQQLTGESATASIFTMPPGCGRRSPPAPRPIRTSSGARRSRAARRLSGAEPRARAGGGRSAR